VDKQRESAVLVIAASIVAAIRLRGDEIKPNTPRMRAVAYDSVLLVREIMREVERPR
jgi:hypothetical protein